LIALAQAHDILTREHWEGAELRDVVTQAVTAYADMSEQGRLRIAGPALRLRPTAALALSMALHELATNAVKYGALSTETGALDVSWTLENEPGAFSFRWAESGGPAVTPPERRGFGSRLIEQGLSQDLGGEARLIYRHEGLVCEIHAPVDEIRAAADGDLVSGGFGLPAF
jgi:two-component sensor histidine kinase